MTPSRKNFAVPARQRRPCSAASNRRAASSGPVDGSKCIGTTILSVSSPRASSSRQCSRSSGSPSITWAPVSPAAFSAPSVGRRRRVAGPWSMRGRCRAQGTSPRARAAPPWGVRRSRDDLGVLRELARAVDPRSPQRLERRQGRVPVEEVQQRRATADGVLDLRGADACLAKRLVADRVPQHPVVRRRAVALGAQQGADLVDRARTAQIRATGQEGSVETGGCGSRPGRGADRSGAVDDLGRPVEMGRTSASSPTASSVSPRRHARSQSPRA